MPSLRKTAMGVLTLVIGSTIYADYWAYSRQYHINANQYLDVIHSRAKAPEQYRIAVSWLAEQLWQHAHIPLTHGFALIDLASVTVVVCLCFLLLERSPAFRAADMELRWFAAALFVGLMEYSLPWVTSYQRPETLPCAAVVAATLWLLNLRLPAGRFLPAAATCAGMLALAAIQGFIRADVAFILHLGVLLVCCTRAGGGFALSRWAQAATSAAAMLLCGGIQVYLMLVVFPGRDYGDTKVIQLALNAIGWRMQLLPFVLFTAPWAWTMAMLMRQRARPESAMVALAAGSVLYLVMWLTVGRMEEVRIFLPFAIAFTPLTCVLAMGQLARATADRRPRPGPVQP